MTKADIVAQKIDRYASWWLLKNDGFSDANIDKVLEGLPGYTLGQGSKS
jgi:hypothetical protein